jgi:hypothetical protein
MKRGPWLLGLLGSTAIGTTPALAQQTASPAATSSEIEHLQSEVAALQARLDALEAAPPADAPASAPTPAPSDTASTKIGGKAYFNISNIDQQSDGADSSQNGLQTDVKRFYLTVDHRFSDIFSANLTTDFRYGSNGLSRDTTVYVKKAYLQAKIAPELIVRVGAADLPWAPFVENIYGYRFVENTLIDRTKYGASADWGVHVGGSLAHGLVDYAVSAVNGAGYKTLARSSDTIDLEGRLSVQPLKHVVLAVGGYSGKLGKSSAGAPDTDHRATRFDALAAYTGPRVRAGIEYFNAHDWKNVTSAAHDRSSGWSAFGSFAFTPKLAVFGRYDWVDPDRVSTPRLKERYFNLGLDYQVVKDVDLALVYKRDRADHGFVPTSNGTIGGADRGAYDEIGIWSQIKF